MQKKYILLVVILAFILMTGCGQVNTDIAEVNSEVIDTDSQTAISWDTLTLKHQEKFTDEEGMYLTGYEEGWIQEPDKNYSRCITKYASFAGDFCVLKSYLKDEKESFDCWYTMYYYDCDSKQTKIVDISYDLWEISSTCNIAYFDIVSTGKIAFAFMKYKEGTKTGTYDIDECRVAFYDLEEGADGIVDITAALIQANVSISNTGISSSSLAVDKNGNIYLVDRSEVVVMDKKGKLIATMHVADTDYVIYTGKTMEGKPLFYTKSSFENIVTFFCYDEDAKKTHILGEVKGYFSMYMTTDQTGTIFCIEGDNIVAWNSLTGEKRKLLNLKDNGICGNSMQVLLACLSDGSLAILDTATEESIIYYLSNEKLVENCVITIDAVGEGWDLAKTTAAVFSRRSQGITVEYTDNYDEETYKVKMLSDFMEGKGADMLVIPYEDFLPLYEKGLLADLTDVFDEETKTQVISQVWKPGTIEGKLFGLQSNNLHVMTIVAPKKYVHGNGWTLDDIFELMEEGKDSLQGFTPLLDGKENLLYYLTILNLSIRFIDYESGICKFDCKDFRKLLELCKNNEIFEDDWYWYGGPNQAKEVVEGNYLANYLYIDSLTNYGYELNYHGPDYCYIGLPTDSGIGNMFLPGAMLVVNKNTQHMDIIKDYLIMLYSKPIQRQELNCVRKDVILEYTTKDVRNDAYEFDMGGNKFLHLETKSDGSNYVEDYFDFVESALPIPAKADEILQIVIEEAKEYFYKNADIDRTVKTIQNRVQLMLDEMK